MMAVFGRTIVFVVCVGVMVAAGVVPFHVSTLGYVGLGIGAGFAGWGLLADE